jgi:hypothetical protein
VQRPPAGLYQAIVAFTRIEAPLQTRPPENYLLEYKSELTDGVLDEIAAFANTYGGLLLIGIKEKNTLPVEIVGIGLSRFYFRIPALVIPRRLYRRD